MAKRPPILARHIGTDWGYLRLLLNSEATIKINLTVVPFTYLLCLQLELVSVNPSYPSVSLEWNHILSCCEYSWGVKYWNISYPYSELSIEHTSLFIDWNISPPCVIMTLFWYFVYILAFLGTPVMSSTKRNLLTWSWDYKAYKSLKEVSLKASRVLFIRSWQVLAFGFRLK